MSRDESNNDNRGLDVVQRWFQAVITHPDGVGAGADSDAAQRLIAAGRDELERVVRRSQRLTAAERMGIYANAYYARLLEVLRHEFPVLCRAVGEDVFNGYAFGYLQQHPSRSYTLGRLADGFADYLDATRPEDTRGRLAWPDLLVDLARLEWHIGQVFDGPGIEGMTPVSAGELAAIPPDRFAEARLTPVRCLRLLSFRFPVNTYWTEMKRVAPDDRDEETLPFPEPAEQHVALFRREFIVRRHEIGRAQLELLRALQRGDTVRQAIEAAAATTDMPDAELADRLRDWFRVWSAEQLFEAVAY